MPGRLSEKMAAPSSAVSMKLALVLMMDTRTVDEASVRARVKRPHMAALKTMLSRKKNCRGVSGDARPYG